MIDENIFTHERVRHTTKHKEQKQRYATVNAIVQENLNA